MNNENRIFLNSLNTSNEMIDINHISVEQLARLYERYGQWYCEFMKTQQDPIKKEENKREKAKYDKLYLFWINPFNISLRNAIGNTGTVKEKVEKGSKDITGRAILTQETTNKIKSRYIKDMEKQSFTINPDKAKEELIKIIEEILNEQHNDGKKEREINNVPSMEQMPIQYIETYTYNTETMINSYIKKYKISFEHRGIEYSKEMYGEIDLVKFYKDKRYQRVVLEAIEDLEIENYRDKTNNNYIGNFRSVIKDGIQFWRQEISESDLDAIKKIENMDEKCRKIAMQKNNFMKLGKGR